MEVLNKATARVHNAVDQVANAATPAAKWLEERGDTLTTGGEKMLDSTVKYIAAHPGAAVVPGGGRVVRLLARAPRRNGRGGGDAGEDAARTNGAVRCRENADYAVCACLESALCVAHRL